MRVVAQPDGTRVEDFWRCPSCKCEEFLLQCSCNFEGAKNPPMMRSVWLIASAALVVVAACAPTQAPETASAPPVEAPAAIVPPLASVTYEPADIRACGLVWSHDEGRFSVWRATRAALVGVGSYNSSGRFTEGLIPLQSGQQLAIEMHRQRARCIRS